MPVVVRVVERSMKTRDDDATPMVFARLTGVCRPACDEDCRGCREPLGGGCGVTKTGRGSGDVHPGRGRSPLARAERARMVMVAVAAVTVVAALLLASG